ncbi:MAG: hypothetical protein H6658_04835 [Ardenticatenaceae bacterium]|nr:hypothetical protein [Ardenticatenaceae bacterium]
MIEEPREKTAVALAIVLWLLTSILSIICLLTARSMFLNTLARFTLGQLIPTANWIILISMVCFCIAVIIGGFEFHFRTSEPARSWQIFSWTIGIEAAILLLALFI